MAEIHRVPVPSLTVRWKPEHPLDLAAWALRFTRWGPEPCTVVAGGAVHRVVGDTMWRATQDGPVIDVDVVGDADVALTDLRARVGDDVPVGPLIDLAARDARVADLVARHPGYRLPITPDPFEATVAAIAVQQVNMRWALTTRTRLIQAYGSPRYHDGVTVWRFPAPEAVAAADPADLRAMQFTTAKSRTIVELARLAADGYLDGLDRLGTEAVVEHLSAVKGIGRWTAEQVLARSLARPDVVAAGDLGVRKAVSFLWHDADELLDEATVRDTAATWGDAANWVVHLLLEDLAESQVRPAHLRGSGDTRR